MNVLSAVSEAVVLWKTALPAMFIGCCCGVMMNGGGLGELSRKAMEPITSLVKLPNVLGSFFMFCLINRYTANAMLAELGRNFVVTRTGIVATYLMGALPTGIYYTVFYFSPALIGGLGWQLGVTFAIINTGISAMVTLAGVLINRICYQGNECSVAASKEGTIPIADTLELTGAIKIAIHQFWDMAKIFMPITLLFAWLMHSSQITDILAGVNPALQRIGLTSAGALVIMAGIPTLIAGIGVAGTLLHSGALAPGDVIFSLLIASFFHSIYDFWSSVLPTNISIFGARMGVTLAVMGTVIRIAIVGMVVLLFP
jgi:hypothetical protein